MKQFKSLMALLLSLIMVFSVVGTALAADPSYDAKVSVTALAENDTAYFYKIAEWVGSAEGNVGGWKTISPFTLDLSTVLGTPENPNTQATEFVAAQGISADMAEAQAAIVQDSSKNTPVAATVTVSSSGVAELDVTADGLGAGIYMVLVKPANPDVVYNPVFVSSDFKASPDQDPNTNTWAVNESATFSDSAAAKKSTTTLDKQAATDEVAPDDVKWQTTAIGDTVHFTVTTTIPGFGPAFVNPFFKITDKLTDLTLVSGSVKVKSPADAATAANIVEGTDQYTIDWNTAAGKAYLATVKVPTVITIEYDAIVATSAPYNVNTEKNEVWTEFSHNINDEEDHSFKKDTTQHYTFTLDANVLAGTTSQEGRYGSEIVKVGRTSTGQPINETKTYSKVTATEYWEGPQAEAHFKLYRAYDATTNTCSSEYTPKTTTGTAGAVLDIKSGADGRMTIEGLDAGEYWLKEVSCPDGFVMDTHVAHIVIAANTTSKDVTEYTKDGTTWLTEAQYTALADKTGYKSYTYATETLDSYTVTIDGVVASSYTFQNEGNEVAIKWTDEGTKELPHQFVNTEGLQLPSTGGIGTTIFYVAGIVLVLGAAAIIIARRKAEQE